MSRPVVLQDGTGIAVTVPGIGHMMVFGETVPTNGSRDYATGCLFIQTDGGANTALWRNEGTSSSSSFVAVSSGGGGGLTNFTDTLADAAPNDVVPVATLSAYGAAADIDLAIVPKGTGAIIANVPDDGSPGGTGNKRGVFAVDLQRYGGYGAYVASGAYSVITGGGYNTASGQYSVVSGGNGNTASNNRSVVSGGLSNTASGSNSVVSGGNGNTASSSNSVVSGGLSNTASGLRSVVSGGQNNTASSDSSTVSGGNNNTASGNYSVVSGGLRATTRGIQGMSAIASGRFAADGDAQEGGYRLRKQTTDATPTYATADAGAQSATNQPVLPNNSAYAFRVLVIAHRTDAVGTRAVYSFVGGIKRDANAASTAILTATKTVVHEDDATWDCDLEADTTNGALAVKVTGKAANTIQWVAKVETIETFGG